MAIAALTFLVFSPALLNGFVEWDDSVNLFENPSYRGLGWKQIRWMLTSTLMGHYIPVTWLTFGLDYTLWGMNPLGYHLTSTLIHATNAALCYLIALRLLAKATSLTGPALRLAGATGALLFALHPLRAESVAWATERRDVLSGLFFLLTVLLYLASTGAQGRGRRRLLAASLAAFGLALLSKSIVMTLPLVLLLLDVYPLRRMEIRWGLWRDTSARTVMREKLPYVALGLGGALASYWVLSSHDFVMPLERYGWSARMAMVAHSLWFYLQKTILPVALSPLHELPAAVDFLEPRFLLSGIGTAVISFFLLAVCRRWPAGLAVWIYYGIVLAPVSGIVQSGHQLAHDRYSYLSCLGWALLAGAAVGSVARSGARVRPWLAGAATAMAAAWVLALATLTWQQVQVWRDDETLWRHAVDADSHCGICQGNLGSALYDRKLLALAKERFDLALAMRPDRLRPHGALGLVLASMGDFEGGIRHLGIAVAHYPNDPDILTDMGVILADQKHYTEAIAYLERANQISPNHVPGLVTLGYALVEAGQPQKGLGYLLRARELRPEEPVLHYDLARAYLALGDHRAARDEYDIVVRTDPQRARLLEDAFSPVR